MTRLGTQKRAPARRSSLSQRQDRRAVGAASSAPTPSSSVGATSSNVRVVVRVRPENSRELAGNHASVVRPLDDNMLIFDPRREDENEYYQGRLVTGRNLHKKVSKDQQYVFDRVYHPHHTNQQVFESNMSDLVDGVMDGYNCSVFAYGSTGAGKTFTMIGTTQAPGIVFLTVLDLYDKIAKLPDKKYIVHVSYLEVYNETVSDLLSPGRPLDVRDDGQRLVTVNGLSQHKPDGPEHLMTLLEKGNKNRSQHPTDMNAESSRSHAVFQVLLRQSDSAVGLSADMKVSKLSLIDLAGSERGSATGHTGIRFREGANINKSLLALGSCINALADGKKFVPYRGSKLTRLLKDSIGGNCKTLMIAAVTPSSASYEDTHNTLRYAERAKTIKSRLQRNVVSVDFHVSRYAKIVEELQQELATLKTRLEEAESRPAAVASEDPVALTAVGAAESQRRTDLDETLRLEAECNQLRVRLHRRRLARQRIGSARTRVGQPPADRHEQRLHAQLSGGHTRLEEARRQLRDSSDSARAATEALQPGPQAELLGQLMQSQLETAEYRVLAAHLDTVCRIQQHELSHLDQLCQRSLPACHEQYLLLQHLNFINPKLESQRKELLSLLDGQKEVCWADMRSPSRDSPGQASYDVLSLLRLGSASQVPVEPWLLFGRAGVLRAADSGLDASVLPLQSTAVVSQTTTPLRVAATLRSHLHHNQSQSQAQQLVGFRSPQVGKLSFSSLLLAESEADADSDQQSSPVLGTATVRAAASAGSSDGGLPAVTTSSVGADGDGCVVRDRSQSAGVAAPSAEFAETSDDELDKPQASDCRIEHDQHAETRPNDGGVLLDQAAAVRTEGVSADVSDPNATIVLAPAVRTNDSDLNATVVLSVSGPEEAVNVGSGTIVHAAGVREEADGSPSAPVVPEEGPNMNSTHTLDSSPPVSPIRPVPAQPTTSSSLNVTCTLSKEPPNPPWLPHVAAMNETHTLDASPPVSPIRPIPAQSSTAPNLNVTCTLPTEPSVPHVASMNETHTLDASPPVSPIRPVPVQSSTTPNLNVTCTLPTEPSVPHVASMNETHTLDASPPVSPIRPVPVQSSTTPNLNVTCTLPTEPSVPHVASMNETHTLDASPPVFPIRLVPAQRSTAPNLNVTCTLPTEPPIFCAPVPIKSRTPERSACGIGSLDDTFTVAGEEASSCFRRPVPPQQPLVQPARLANCSPNRAAAVAGHHSSAAFDAGRPLSSSKQLAGRLKGRVAIQPTPRTGRLVTSCSTSRLLPAAAGGRNKENGGVVTPRSATKAAVVDRPAWGRGNSMLTASPKISHVGKFGLGRHRNLAVSKSTSSLRPLPK